MKKTIFTLSALTLALTLTGCNDSDKAAQTDVQSQPEAEVTTQAPTVTNETDGMAKVPAVTEQESTSEDNAVASVKDDVNSLPATAAGAAEDIQTATDNAIDSATDTLNETKETLTDK